MKLRPIQWICLNDPESTPDQGKYYVSLEGRFYISPNFRHTIYPSHYTLEDKLKHMEKMCENITEAKQTANDIVFSEATKGFIR